MAVFEWSFRAKRARSVFFEKYNDVDIYVEDTGNGAKKLYALIFGRLMQGKYRVAEVFPLGGKERVLRECEGDQERGDRPKIYVVDGDLDLLTGKSLPKLRKLVMLPRYSIENFLIDKLAVLSILDEEDVERDRGALERELGFEKWVSGNQDPLFELFVVFALAREIIPSRKTVSEGVGGLVSSDNGIVDRGKVDARKKEVLMEIEKVMEKKRGRRRMGKIRRDGERCRRDLLSYVSGKEFVLPLLLRRMRKTVKLRADNVVVKQRLAMRCDLSELGFVLDVVRRSSG